MVTSPGPPGLLTTEHKALQVSFTLNGEIFAGIISSRSTLRLVKEWAAADEEELKVNWNRARAGESLARIPPLG